jgi:dephospho-CoA kinase
MLKLGLTGGIGSGKSSAARMFSERGVPVIDTDVIAHQLTAAGGAALPAIRAAFGAEVLQADGALERGAMRRRVFSDVTERRRLEAILHPLIRQSVEQQLARLDSPYVLVVIPLLLESGDYRDLLDRILVVDSAEARQVERVRARSGLSPDDTRAIIAAQASREQRLAAADEVLDNNGSLAHLRDQIDLLHRKYLAIAGGLP